MEPGYDIEDVIVLQETRRGEPNEGAILISAPVFGVEKVWIAKNQITEDSEVYEMGTEGTLSITEWLAKKKGWL